MAEFVSRLDSVGDQWAAPTPCPDWDVRALVNHIVGEDLWTVPLMEGATIEEVGDRFDGDLLGDDPVAAARGAADAATIATGSGVVAGRTVHLSFGDTPAEEYAYQLAADHLVHGWDLAAAVGGDRQFDPELVRRPGGAVPRRGGRGRAPGRRGAGRAAGPPARGVRPPARLEGRLSPQIGDRYWLS